MAGLRGSANAVTVVASRFQAEAWMNDVRLAGICLARRTYGKRKDV